MTQFFVTHHLRKPLVDFGSNFDVQGYRSGQFMSAEKLGLINCINFTSPRLEKALNFIDLGINRSTLKVTGFTLAYMALSTEFRYSCV